MPFLDWLDEHTLNVDLKSWLTTQESPTQRLLELALKVVEGDVATTSKAKQNEGIAEGKGSFFGETATMVKCKSQSQRH